MAKKSLAELEAEQQKLSKERDAIRDKQLKLKAEMDELAATETADNILQGLSPGQIDAVAKAAAVRVKGNSQDAG